MDTQLDRMDLVSSSCRQDGVGEPGCRERWELALLALVAEGWHRTCDRLTSPSGDVWVPAKVPDIHALRNRTASRLYELVVRKKPAEATVSAELRSLLLVLEDLSDDGGLETFFRPLSGAVRAYVSQEGLRVMKYPGASPTWQLFDRHPVGGVAIIELLKTGPSTLCVRLLWRRRFHNDIDERRVWQSGEIPNDGGVLAGLLPSVHEYLTDWQPPETVAASGILHNPFFHPEELPLVFAR